jgi:hypothetical protein
MKDNHFNVLKRIACIFNESNITWALGASMMLKLRHFDIDVHDIDFMVNSDDFEKACFLLNQLGKLIPVEESTLFKTSNFKRFICEEISIDLMSGMGIQHKSGYFDYQFKINDIDLRTHLDSIEIPLCYLEDWYVFYHFMPNRENTIQKIEAYFNEHQYNSNRFVKLLNLSLTNQIRVVLTDLIENENIKF